jgi:hypothetical protein
MLHIGAVYFGSTVVFNISNSSFTSCASNDYVGGGTGGGIFSSSSSSGLRYLTGLTFGNNSCGRCVELRKCFTKLIIVYCSCNFFIIKFFFILFFFFFYVFFCIGYGTDMTDSSSNVLDHYSRVSVSNCVSTSNAIKFYSSDKNLSLDCLLTGECPTDYFYVSSDGVDFDLCGDDVSPCQTIV